jgi:LDH2 family malate/lactate/ureidoglycolate dehydrogenase
VSALEPLVSLQERVATTSGKVADQPVWLRPEVGESRRKQSREHGIPLRPQFFATLESWASRLGVTEPPPGR